MALPIDHSEGFLILGVRNARGDEVLFLADHRVRVRHLPSSRALLEWTKTFHYELEPSGELEPIYEVIGGEGLGYVNCPICFPGRRSELIDNRKTS